MLSRIKLPVFGGALWTQLNQWFTNFFVDIDKRHYEMDSATISPDSEEGRLRANATTIVKQAFVDMGFKGPVDVIFEKQYFTSPLTTAAVSVYTHNMKRSALVAVGLGKAKNGLTLPNLSENLYAIGGHEAVHATHYHQNIEHFASAALVMSMIKPIIKHRMWWAVPYLFGMWNFNKYLFTPFISRIMEKDADITSAKQLKTANISADFFADYVSLQYSMPLEDHSLLKLFELKSKIKDHPSYSRYTYTHPPTLDRAIYLKQLDINQMPTFFQSDAFIRIKEELATANKKRLIIFNTNNKSSRRPGI
jgi:hypothetical protein